MSGAHQRLRRPLALKRCPPFGLALLLCAGCPLGQGEGFVRGVVTEKACELDAQPYELAPTFFGADSGVGGLVEIRVQRGSDIETFADGLVILVLDAATIQRERLGEPIPVRSEFMAPVRMGFYLNETCPITREEMPVYFEATDGEIVFEAIWAPEASPSEVETRARFDDVTFSLPGGPEESRATLSGQFRFLFNRGRPAQRFP